MLDSKDRIFDNLYGFEPWNLASAKLRGDWDNTKDILLLSLIHISEPTRPERIADGGFWV